MAIKPSRRWFSWHEVGATGAAEGIKGTLSLEKRARHGWVLASVNSAISVGQSMCIRSGHKLTHLLNTLYVLLQLGDAVQ